LPQRGDTLVDEPGRDQRLGAVLLAIAVMTGPSGERAIGRCHVAQRAGHVTFHIRQ
jgi:hypothetical protein